MESLNSKKQLPPSPREKANLISYITFAWAIPIFLKGRNQTIGDDDLFQPLNEQKASGLANKIKDSWNKEEEKCRKDNKKPWLVSVLRRVFGYEVLFQGLFLLFIECGLKILPPIFLNQIIKYHENKDKESEAVMYWSTFGITLCIFFNVIIMHAFNLSNLNLGLKMRIAVSTLIYDKCLQLSKSSLANVSLGKIVNLLSSDVGRFDSTAFGFHYLWVGPIQTILVTYLIYNEIGWSAFGGVALILLMIPLQLFLGKTTAMLRMKTALRTDKRIKLMNEIIQGIQTIKMYAWEKPMAALISQTRGKEIRMIRFVSWIKGITLSLMLFSSRVSIFTSLILFAILGNLLTAQKAFVVTAYYNVLRQTMVIMYPLAINNVAECRVAIQRIQQLLFITDTNNNEKQNKCPKISSASTYIKMRKVFAKWNSQSPEMTLTDINIDISSPSLNIVVGRVGSGKSNMIQAILNELPIETGEIDVNGKISYASQVPWLFSGSVKQNIVFGLPFDKNRYNSVIKACSLSRDFELWTDGDETIVGERGMSLSGGQKARISLARAVYREADIYLLDDQLSAVDSHVQKHLFENCIKDFLKDKIVILVTHQLQYLPFADQIFLFENGKILAKGNFETLKNSGLDFTKHLDFTIEENNDTEILKRQISKEVEKPLQKEENKKVDRSEKRAEGSIGWKIYNEYFQATGGYLVMSFIMVFFVIAQLMASASDYFVSYWVSKESQRDNENQLVVYDRNVDIYIFSALTFATVLLTFGRSFMFFNVAMQASRRLHDAMFNGISRAKMFFFNTNPSGRILNRFSKDLNQIDEMLPFTLIDVFQILFSFLGTIGVLAVVNQFYLIPTFILFFIFYQIRQVYIKISLDVKRLSSTTSSPVFSYLSETLTGLSIIRAYKLEDQLKSEFFNHLDLNTSSHYIWLAMTRTFAFWLDMCCFIYIAIVIISFFFTNSTSGNVGLAITQAMSLTNMVQLGMRQSAVLENLMTAVERVVEYQTVDPEPAFESENDKKPPKEWPEKGQVKFEKLSLSYFPDMKEKVLKELEFEINPQEKIGICGRTGAGKSSIINALFRLSYLDGKIEIDLRDTAKMGLHDLRSKISIIPQEPVLFSNSMRYNLDPFNEYSDEKLWSALEEVNLKKMIKETPAGLNMAIAEGGTNLSVGERQLVCLARAILRENKIIVMDEATANVDLETDELIQKTIRQKFKNCTLIMIAHRLNSVMDSDRILVMDAGKCVEFGSPYELLNKTEEPKYFYEMLQNTGKGNFESLKKIAEENHLIKKMK